jgi:hypothetical protein
LVLKKVHSRMALDEQLVSEDFPRTSQYHPDWLRTHASGGANSLWLAEWLAPSLDLRPGSRVLDLGCVRVVGRRGGAKLEEHCRPDTLKTVVPPQYTQQPLLRGQRSDDSVILAEATSDLPNASSRGSSLSCPSLTIATLE